MVARLASPRHFLMSPELTRPDWLKMRQRNSKFLWLDKNENTDPTLRRLIDQLVGELDSSVYSIYPDNGVLYRKLGEHLNVLPEQVILTPGSDGAIRSLFEAYVAPEDVVIHVQPTFAMYTVYCQIYGAKPVVMDYQPSTIGPILDVDAFVCAIKTHQPKLVCLANPGSPTGTVLPANELRRIIEATADVSGIMLVDEAYYPFYSKTVVGWLSEYKHLVVARSFAKAWGLAGFRVGCAIGSSDVIGILHKIRPMYEVNTLAICMLEKMLDYYDEVLQSVKRLEKGKQYF